MEGKIENLKEVFNTMVYGENLENTTQADEWLRKIEISDKSTDIDHLAKNVKANVYIPNRQQLIEIAKELEKKVNIISQIEVLSRGVLLKDTKKAVNLLTQYFYYYASFVNKNKNVTSVVVGIFEDDHPLWLLGLFLAPALASGHTVVLQTGTKFAIVVTYIVEILQNVGLPKDAVILVPSNEGELQPYLSDKNIWIIAIFVDLFNEKYRGINSLHKKIMVFSGYKTPMLVFENADLDSAVESVIDAAWGYQGMLPWSVDSILVQENVFSKFVEKIKSRIKTLRVGTGDDKMADISFPNNPKVIQKLNQAVNKAKSLGIEVYQKENPSNSFTPTLIVGSRVFTNNVLSASESNSTVTLLAFRSIDEAVNLANNTRQGLGASVWSENIGLVNEVSRKLKVGNVWINSHGLFSPEIALVPVKESGVGYFGGPEGFYEFDFQYSYESPNSLELPSHFKSVDAIKNALNSGRTACRSWTKTSFLNKLKIFQEMEDFVNKNKNKFLENLPETWLDNFTSILAKIVHVPSPSSSTSTLNGYSVTMLKEPKGVLIIEMKNRVEEHNILLLLAAIISGNAVILLKEAQATQEFYKEISKKLPAGILSVLPYNLDSVKSASQYRELDGYFSAGNIIFGSIPLVDSKIFDSEFLDADNVFFKVNAVKNIWSNIGQSSQCNL